MLPSLAFVIIFMIHGKMSCGITVVGMIMVLDKV